MILAVLLLAAAAAPTPAPQPTVTPTPTRTPVVASMPKDPMNKGDLSSAASGRKINRSALEGWDPTPVANPQSGVPITFGETSPLEGDANAFCRQKWGSNFEMIAFCQKQQREALDALGRPGPPDIPSADFSKIRSDCAVKWGPNLEMRVFCEKQQTSAYRKVK